MNIRIDEILIREADVEDADLLCGWWNDGAVMAHAGFPLGLGTTAEKIVEKLGDQNRRHIIVYGQEPIGEMNFNDLGGGVCEIGIKICRADMREKGIGKKVLSMFIGELFGRLGYTKILLDTNLDNRRAQHVYERLGFKKLRVRYNSWKNQLGVPQSAVDYELVPEDFVSFI